MIQMIQIALLLAKLCSVANLQSTWEPEAGLVGAHWHLTAYAKKSRKVEVSVCDVLMNDPAGVHWRSDRARTTLCNGGLILIERRWCAHM
jgi:hypothetical protein